MKHSTPFPTFHWLFSCVSWEPLASLMFNISSRDQKPAESGTAHCKITIRTRCGWNSIVGFRAVAVTKVS